MLYSSCVPPVCLLSDSPLQNCREVWAHRGYQCRTKVPFKFVIRSDVPVLWFSVRNSVPSRAHNNSGMAWHTAQERHKCPGTASGPFLLLKQPWRCGSKTSMMPSACWGFVWHLQIVTSRRSSHVSNK